MNHETTKREIGDVANAVEVLCRIAAGYVTSYMPRGLGKPFEKEANELEFLLTEIPMRFKRAIEKGQAKGWAAK